MTLETNSFAATTMSTIATSFPIAKFPDNESKTFVLAFSCLQDGCVYSDQLLLFSSIF